MPCAMRWPASAQSELIQSGSFWPIALKTGLPIFIAISWKGFFTP